MKVFKTSNAEAFPPKYLLETKNCYPKISWGFFILFFIITFFFILRHPCKYTYECKL